MPYSTDKEIEVQKISCPVQIIHSIIQSLENPTSLPKNPRVSSVRSLVLSTSLPARLSREKNLFLTTNLLMQKDREWDGKGCMQNLDKKDKYDLG